MTLLIDEKQNNSSTKPNETAASNVQDQMIELQMSTAHLERTVEQLDKVVTRQDQHIQTLQRQIQLINKQLQNQNGDQGIAPFDVVADKPPHY